MGLHIAGKEAEKLLALLWRMDDGYILTEKEQQHLKNISLAYFTSLKLVKLPESIGELSQLTELDVSNNQLTSLPESIGELSQLIQLNVSNNRLTSLPESIGKLPQLTRLDVFNNQLTSLPDSIVALSQLTKLNVSNNRLISLPDSIGELSQLTWLDVFNNQLTSLPDSIGALSQLTWLHVSFNQLTSLPESISALSQLTWLGVSRNRLTSLPDSIGALSQLTQLHISHNQLISLPESISALSQLTQLNVSNNRLTSLPESISALSQLTRLHVSHNWLTSLPDSIDALSQLTWLDVSGNRLTSLLDSIGTLSQLTCLYVSFNQLTSLPESISTLSQLTLLDVSRNQLTSLPESISALSQLTRLHVSFNQLTSLPDSIGALSQLTWLHVSFNQLTSLPESISALSQLTRLHVSHNQLTSLPDSIGALSQLTRLHVSHNQLTSLPESISALSQLTQLHISHNQLTSLPDSIGGLYQLMYLDISALKVQKVPYWIQQLSKLEGLHLGFNPLKTLPDWLGDMPNLLSLDLSFLQLTAIPRSLLKLGIPFLADRRIFQAIEFKGICIENTKLSIQPVSLFDQSRDKSPGFQESRKLIEEYFETPKIPVREAKVIFLGDGKVGKTYTIQRLLQGCRKGDYPTKETHGILIDDLYVEKDRERYNIRVWDFGGQDIMHEMHRCFLTDRTCYVVMIDTRIDKQTRRARYWLRTVQNIAPNAPVLLLVNEVSGGKNRDLDYSSLQQEFSNLKGVEYCSSMDASDEDFRLKVEQTIFRQALDLDSCKMELPKSWENVRQNLLSLRSSAGQGKKGAYYIDRQTFHSLCEQYDVPADNGLRAWLLTWLNDLGVCFSYHLGEDGQERSNDYKILDPMWLTSAVYKIIWEKEQTNDGLITLSEIHRILEKPGSAAMKKDGIPCLEDVAYNEQECSYVLDIMRMFRISYPADIRTEFIPALCKTDSKLDPIPERWSQHAAYRFRYAFLPETVLHRLMIFCYANLRTGRRWRKGFWLECESQGLSAVIRTEGPDSEENELQIDVYAQREEYEAWMWLQPLCQQLMKINDTLSLKAEVFVLAKNRNEEKWFSLDSVWHWKNQGAPDLQGERSLFPIQPLMDLIYGRCLPTVEKKLKEKREDSRIISPVAYPKAVTAGVTELTQLDLSKPFEEQLKIGLELIAEVKRSNDLREREIEVFQENIVTVEEHTATLWENTWTLQRSNELLCAIRDGRVQVPSEVMDALAKAFRQSDAPALKAAGKKMKWHFWKTKGQLLRDLLGDTANLATVAPVLVKLGEAYGPTLLKILETLVSA